VTREETPPCYKGRMPLSYKVAYPPWGLPGYAYSSAIPLYFDFGMFKTMFVYNDTTLVGAQAVDANGRLVGEAKLRYYVTAEQTQGIEADEVHYDANGSMIFHCKSEIGSENGFKTKEGDITGNKLDEYFFVWPER
jgi:hypothetical protein